ncbi:MAG: acyltransferase [Streptosporangiaceae bacterium]|jgi:acetyltransferase-like isoleucine patch superfamily enzyme
MLPGISIGDGLDADAGVTLGYASARQQGQRLVVGVHARVRSGTVLYLGSRIGARFQTGHNVVIREDCAIGNDVSVWSNSVVDYGCSIGDRVKIHSNCYVAQFTEIGADAFLAPGVAIANDLYPGQASSARVMAGPCIGPGAQIGVNATILPFVRIGAGCLVGAGAVVARDIPDGAVAFGNPATVRGEVNDLDAIESRIAAVETSVSRYQFSVSARDGNGNVTSGRRSR